MNSRRRFLKGALSLPLLASAPAWAASTPPRRVLWWFVPNGLIDTNFFPNAVGTFGTLPKTLAPFEAFRDRMTVLGGMNNIASAQSEVFGGHPSALACMLTDVPIYGLEKIDGGVSVDQVIAKGLTTATPYPSLQLGLGQSTGAHGDVSDVYKSVISYGAPQMPLASLTDPGALYDLLFPAANIGNQSAYRTMRSRVVDFAHQRTATLRGRVATEDRYRIDEYLSGLDHVTQRLSLLDKITCDAPDQRAFSATDLGEITGVMGDLMVSALTCDHTRVITWMMGPSGANTVFQEFGATENHHVLGHEFLDVAEYKNQLEQIEVWEMELLATFLHKMANVTEPDDTDLLSNTMVVLCSEFSDHTRHFTENLPLAVFGGESAGFTHGSFRREPNRNLADLWLDVLEFMGTDPTGFGQFATSPLGL